MHGYHSPGGLEWEPSAQALWVADGDPRDSPRLTVVTSQAKPKRGTVRAALALPAGSRPSAVAFYRFDRPAALHDNLFVASDEGRHLLRLRLDSRDGLRIVSTERLLQDRLGGIRAVAVGYDRTIYVATATGLAKLVPILQKEP